MPLGLSNLRLGLSALRSGTSLFGVTITGLTDGEARIGDHASIGYTTDPVSATETVKWSNSSDPAAAATYGTGASPADYTAGDEGSLWLHVTDTIGGETSTVSRNAPIRYAAGTASAIADGQTATVDDTVLSIAAAATGANLTFTYSLLNAPAGMTTNASTGGIGGTVTEVFDGTVTLRATDQYGRTLDDTFTFTSSLRAQATAAGGLGPFNWTVDDTAVSVDATTDFTANGNTLTYTATGLPAGVTIASNGIISGTPTAASSGSIVITGQDEYGRETTSTTSHTTALRTQATGGTDLDLSFVEDSAITSTDLKANWTANGNTLTYAITGTALPAGLSVSSAGVMTGTPTTVTADATYTLRGTDEYGRTTDDTFTLEITAAAVGFTDNFNRANEALTASANWSQSLSIGSPSADIVSNTLRLSGDATMANRGAWVYTGTTANDQSAAVTVSGLFSGTTLFAGTIVRDNSITTTRDFYGLLWGSDSSWNLVKFVSGTQTTLATGTFSPAVKVGDKIKIEAIGTNIAAYVDTGSGWTLLGSATDSSHASGNAGVAWSFGSSGNITFDDFVYTDETP